MAKWVSKQVKEPKKDANGFPIEGAGNLGITAWVPVNDAAKATNLSDRAVEMGVYKRSKKDEKEEISKKIRINMYMKAGIPKKEWPSDLI